MHCECIVICTIREAEELGLPAGAWDGRARLDAVEGGRGGVGVGGGPGSREPGWSGGVGRRGV